MGSSEDMIKEGDVIRLNPRKAKGNTLDKSTEIYGRIVTFASHKQLSADVTTYNGKASILYIREPLNVYGEAEDQRDEIMSKESVLPLPLSAIVLRNNTYVKVTQFEIKAISDSAVKSAKIFLIDDIGDPAVDIEEKSRQGIPITQRFYCMGVQLFNALGKQVVSPPQSGNNADKRYKVHLLLKTPANTQWDYKYCQGDSIYYYSEKDKKDNVLRAKDLEQHVSSVYLLGSFFYSLSLFVF